MEALTLADEAADAEVRSVHLQASRYYRDLMEFHEKRLFIRHPTNIGASIQYASRITRVKVSDLSIGGFRMTLDDTVQSADPVTLYMDGLAPFDAFVVWQDGDRVGSRFARDIHPALVGNLGGQA